MKNSLALVSLLAVCISTAAFAADNMMMDNNHMSMMVDKEMKMMGTNNDTNHDGMLSKQEMMDMKMKHMKEIGMMKDSSKM